MAGNAWGPGAAVGRLEPDTPALVWVAFQSHCGSRAGSQYRRGPGGRKPGPDSRSDVRDRPSAVLSSAAVPGLHRSFALHVGIGTPAIPGRNALVGIGECDA